MQCNALNCKAKGAFWEQKIGGSNPLVPNTAFGCGKKAASLRPVHFLLLLRTQWDHSSTG